METSWWLRFIFFRLDITDVGRKGTSSHVCKVNIQISPSSHTKSVQSHKVTSFFSTFYFKFLKIYRLLYSILSIGWTHGAPYRGYGYVPLRFVGNVVRRMGTQQLNLFHKSARQSTLPQPFHLVLFFSCPTCALSFSCLLLSFLLLFFPVTVPCTCRIVLAKPEDLEVLRY